MDVARADNLTNVEVYKIYNGLRDIGLDTREAQLIPTNTIINVVRDKLDGSSELKLEEDQDTFAAYVRGMIRDIHEQQN